jgi:hypothetical protein
MDRNLVREWQSMQFQSAVDAIPFQRQVTGKNPGIDYASLFYTALGLTIGFSLFELAVELLRIASLNEAVALLAATAMWTTFACSAEVLVRSSVVRFYVLFGAGLSASALMLVSHIMLTSLGMCLYTIDCLGKCSVVMLALLVRSRR